jgi:signal transduction histidine kinase
VRISQDKNNGSTNISIQSYGNLIPDDEIQKLFTRGFRSTVHSTVRDGTGMGLHNAGKIIKLYNGELTYSKVSASVDDKKTGWNCFNILLNKSDN